MLVHASRWHVVAAASSSSSCSSARMHLVSVARQRSHSPGTCGREPARLPGSRAPTYYAAALHGPCAVLGGNLTSGQRLFAPFPIHFAHLHALCIVFAAGGGVVRLLRHTNEFAGCQGKLSTPSPSTGAQSHRNAAAWQGGVQSQKVWVLRLEDKKRVSSFAIARTCSVSKWRAM